MLGLPGDDVTHCSVGAGCSGPTKNDGWVNGTALLTQDVPAFRWSWKMCGLKDVVSLLIFFLIHFLLECSYFHEKRLESKFPGFPPFRPGLDEPGPRGPYGTSLKTLQALKNWPIAKTLAITLFLKAKTIFNFSLKSNVLVSAASIYLSLDIWCN